MPKDYKHRVPQRRSRRAFPPWPVVIAGLSIGVLAAAIGYLELHTPHTVQRHAAAPAFASEHRGAPPSRSPTPRGAKEAKKPVADPKSKPRFDFYTLLPEMQVVIPANEIQGKSPPAGFRPSASPERKPAEHPVTTAKPAREPAQHPAKKAEENPVSAPPEAQREPHPAARAGGHLFLQTDAVQNAHQAERDKAVSAMLGLQTSVHKISRYGRGTRYRLRVGPFRDFGALDRARAQLSRHGIRSTPMMLGH